MDYSVLMSVYHKEKAEYLRQSMESMFSQTVLTNDFVLVCDGPLNNDLDAVITEMQNAHSGVLHVVRLKKNMGLGYALNEGIKHCKNELVARMDSDDISKPDRCEKQVAAFVTDNELGIMSATILEFVDDIDHITGRRELPLTHDKICTFSKKRNPFNHPAVMFRKSVVEASGGYKETYHLFEDYYLWVRMLMSGCKGGNLSEPLLFMRTPRDMYKRRGGMCYAKDLLKYHWWLLEAGWTDTMCFLLGAVPHAVICILPNSLRKVIYKILY